MQNNFKRASVAILAGASVFTAGALALGHPQQTLARDPAPAAAQAAPAAGQPAQPPLVRGLPDFTAIVREAGPAVVNVSVVGMQKEVQGPARPVDPDDPFWQLLPALRRPAAAGRRRRRRGLGSGFIVSRDGVILTNAHVVDGATEITVKLTDKREFKAKVVGLDKATDVAVLRIDARDLPTVRLGDPARTQVGEWVLAIGSPFGFENTRHRRRSSRPGRARCPTRGTSRSCRPTWRSTPATPAARSSTWRARSSASTRRSTRSSGGYMGLCFAIPIDVAMKVEEQLLAHGKVTRGRLGVTIQDVDQALAESFGLPRPEGALVSAVEDGQPGRQGRPEAGRRDPGARRPGDRQLLRPAAAGRRHPARQRAPSCEVWRKGRHQEHRAR